MFIHYFFISDLPYGIFKIFFYPHTGEACLAGIIFFLFDYRVTLFFFICVNTFQFCNSFALRWCCSRVWVIIMVPILCACSVCVHMCAYRYILVYISIYVAYISLNINKKIFFLFFPTLLISYNFYCCCLWCSRIHSYISKNRFLFVYAIYPMQIQFFPIFFYISYIF